MDVHPDRKAKIERLKKTDKISGAGVRVVGSTSSLYEVRVNDTARMNDTGAFTLFELIPEPSLSDQLPRFCARYDNTTNEVDTDILLDFIPTLDDERKKKVSRDFKGTRQGYRGHHSQVVTPLRRYQLDLRLNPKDFTDVMDAGFVFEGEILLDRLVFDKNVTLAVVGVGVSVSARVFDKDGNEITSR